MDLYDLLDFRNIFESYRIPVDVWISVAVDWIALNLRSTFQIIKWPIDQTMKWLENFLHTLPALIFLLIFLIIVWRIAGRRIAILATIGLLFLGFIGLWDATMTTFAMVLTAVVFCILIGIPLGILASQNDAFASFLRPVLDTMQTIPSFVYLVPVVMLFGIGAVPAVIATIFYALPPLIRLTNHGIRQVSTEVVEAGQAFGTTRLQLLKDIQLPIALSTIMVGLNQTIMMALGMVVIAAMIAAGGLGLTVLKGINRLDVGLAFTGGIGIVLMAIILDRITQSWAKERDKKTV